MPLSGYSTRQPGNLSPEIIALDLAPVSVVIPAYNSEEFIGEAFASVRGQTLSVSEIIVVDDGSSDRTAELAEQSGAFVIRQKHGGISVARNAGIRAAKHEWIAFLDADDTWEPQKIEYQLAAIRRYPDVGLVSCDLSQWIHGAPVSEIVSDVAGVADNGAPMVYIPQARGAFLIDRMTYNSPAMLIRRELLLSVGLFDEEVRYVEGVECYLRVMARCPIVLVNLPLVRQRLHHQNTSANSVEMRLSWIKMVDRLSAEPEKYPPGAAEALGKDVSGQLIPLGRTLLDDGRMREARNLFVRSLKQKLSKRAAVLWALSFLNLTNFNRLVVAKRRIKVLASRLAKRQSSGASGR
jgi:glycosyltransferase involved in cell wall biosynthesis